MGTEEMANRGAGTPRADGTEGGSFWTSLRGILTAATGLVAAISGLLIGLSQAGIIGGNDKPPPVVIEKAEANPNEKVAAPPKFDPAPKPASLLGAEREYKVGKMSDGFAWVRSEPTVASEGLEQLPSGTHVMCTSRAVVDTVSTVNRTWRYCSAHKGYVSARLLLLIDG